MNQEVGNWWYALILLTPGAYFYYMSNGTRVEEAKVKMVTSDDEKFTDIILQCDKEELERFAMETGYVEKGKVKVKETFKGELTPARIHLALVVAHAR